MDIKPPRKTAFTWGDHIQLYESGEHDHVLLHEIGEHGSKVPKHAFRQNVQLVALDANYMFSWSKVEFVYPVTLELDEKHICP